MGHNPITQQQLQRKYHDIESDITHLLDSFSPGDKPALILDKISHLKRTLSELMDEYPRNSVEYTSIANQYGQTLRAAMDKGVDITPERELTAGIEFEQGTGPDPLSETEYALVGEQRAKNLQAETARAATETSIDPLKLSIRDLSYGIKRLKNGDNGVRKIFFNHRPPTVFDDAWYGGNEVALDTILGPHKTDDMMVATHLAMRDIIEKPTTGPEKSPKKDKHQEKKSNANDEPILAVDINHDDEDSQGPSSQPLHTGLQSQLKHLVKRQQKRQATPSPVAGPNANVHFNRF